MEIKVLFLLWSFCIFGTIWMLIKGADNDV
jgi:hypothetical protein